MNNPNRTLQSLVFAKLESILREVRSLSERISKIESLVNLASPPPPSSKSPELVSADKLFDLSQFPETVEDKLAFATGYLAARMGLVADSTALDFGPAEYREGYELGLGVASGELDQPTWDRS
jgi:hypothetical protein